MKRKLWTLLLALGAALALCVGAGATDFSTGWDEVTNSTITLESGKQYYLSGDVTILQTITVNGTVTLDLNGHVLKYENSTTNGSVLMVEGSGALTIQDSNTGGQEHKFDTTNDLWVLNDNPSEGKAETIQGGVITGGTGRPAQFGPLGGGVYVASGGMLTMSGGNIVGCTATDGGGVFTESTTGGGERGEIYMSGGSITGCVAVNSGGGIHTGTSKGAVFDMSGTAVIRDCRCGRDGGGARVYGPFRMSGQAAIRGCVAEGEYTSGGGVCVNSGSEFSMSNQAVIEDCAARSTTGQESCGGGVYIANTASLTMSGSAVIQRCTAENSSSSEAYGGGVCNKIGTFTIQDNAKIQNCTAPYGSALYNVNDGQGSGIVYADGGLVDGDVVLGNAENSSCTITGIGGTKFNGKVIVAPGSTITNGTFNGEVINNGTITGGEFTGTVNNNGIIKKADDSTGPNFSGTVINGEGGTIAEGVSIATLQFIVTFDNESTRTTKIVAKDSKLTEPTVQTKEGYRFDGWYYTENNAEIKWDFAANNVKYTMTLKAKWVQTHTVTFDTNGGSAVGPVTVDANSTVTKPADPTKSGYTFGGWYKDSALQMPWDFANDTVTTDTMLYAKWNAIVYSDPTYAVSAPTAENGKVAVSPRYAERGECVTVTVTPDEGYELGSLTVTDSRGDALELTDLGGGRYRFTMPARRVEVKASFVKTVETSPFADVATDAYYYEAVKWAVRNGITDGVGNDLFGPDLPCTRAQIVTFLWRAAGSPEPKGTAAAMTDVVSGSYYEKAVAWAIENGVTTGTTATTFSPDATCTRAQAVTFLARARNAKASGAAEFSDVPTDSYFAEAVAWAASNGVTEGVGNGLFAPDDDCTRGQIVTFLWRAYNK